ncbi:MAG: group I intron-associated PD-(D/E)XK endonuclease [Methylococcales bacterium]
MDSKTLNGQLAELSVLRRLVQEGWDVFTPFSGKTAHDIIAYRDSIGVITIQVKSTSQVASSGSYVVELKSVRSNKSINSIKKFNNKIQDVLAVYITTLDTVLFIVSDSITNTSAIRFSLEEIENIKKYSLEELLA